MSNLVDALKQGIKILKRKDDDSYDRLTNRYTMGILMACSLFLATKTYVGDPIDCFSPKEFADNWIKYADHYCLVKNTYFVPGNESLPGPDGIASPDHSSGEELPYYQWVPIILAFMLFIFCIPSYFWRFAMYSSGYDVQAMVAVTSDSENIDPKNRDETNKYIVAQLDRHISYHRSLGRTAGKIPLGNKYGRYLFFMYMVAKLLYIAAPIALLFMLQFMMGPGYSDYGWKAITSLASKDTDYIENPMFPRVTYCNFAVRRLGGNIHRYTVQCVLTVNLFNEKVFLLLWWWLVVLATLSIIGMLICMIKNLRPGGGREFVLKYLRLMNLTDPHSASDAHEVDEFTNNFLSLDGVFCMRLLAQNTTDVVAAEIITELYKRWKAMHVKGSLSDSRNLLSDDKA